MNYLQVSRRNREYIYCFTLSPIAYSILQENIDQLTNSNIDLGVILHDYEQTIHHFGTSAVL